MRVERVPSEALVEAAAELLPAAAGRPPELALPALTAREARYLAELRHGSEPDGTLGLVARDGPGAVGVAAVAPAAFDEAIFGLRAARLVGMEALSAEAAEALAERAVAGARELGAVLVQARLSPVSPCLGALARRGFAAFGANVLYAGAPEGEPPTGVEPATGDEAVEAAARVARGARFDSHLSRDSRLPAGRADLVYDRWLRAEAERGATLLVARGEAGEPVGVAVCRASPLARRLLGLELWHLHLLATLPSARGRGHGRRLALAASAAAARAGATLLQTGVDTAALPAQRLYARLGLLPRASGLALHGWLG